MDSLLREVDPVEKAGRNENFDHDEERESSPVNVQPEDVQVELTEDEDFEPKDYVNTNLADPDTSSSDTKETTRKNRRTTRKAKRIKSGESQTKSKRTRISFTKITSCNAAIDFRSNHKFLFR